MIKKSLTPADRIQSENNDTYILALLALGTLVLRFLTLMEINVGGDNIDYWYYGKSLLRGYPYNLYFHRAVRWGIIIPTVLVQLVFGIRAWVIYIPSILMSVLLNYSVFWVGKRLFNRKTAYLSIILIQFFPYMIRMGSQLFLGVFSMNYILLSFLFLMMYLEPHNEKEEKRSKYWFILSILFLFFSYLTKITNLYFLFPWIIILGKRRGFKPVFYYGLILLSLYFIEHLSYFILLDEPLGRLGIITSTHLGNSTMELNRGHADGTFLGLFRRYDLTHFPLYWHALLWGGIVSAALLWRIGRKEDDPKSSNLRIPIIDLLLILFFFMFLITFGVKDISPITPFENYHPRYFSSVLPFLALIICRLLCEISIPFPGKIPLVFKHNWPVWLFSLPLTAVLILCLSLPVLPSAAGDYLNNPFKWNDHILAKVINWEKQINSAMGNDVLLRTWVDGPEGSKAKRNSKKSLDTVNRLYIHLNKGEGVYPEKFYDNPDGSRYKWIDYKNDMVNPESHGGIYNFFREPFELDEWGD